MGTSHTTKQFVGKINKLSKVNQPALTKKALYALGDEMKAIYVAQTVKTLGQDHFTNWPRKGNKARIYGTTFVPKPTQLEFAPKGRALGPSVVAERGRHAGMSGPMLGPRLTSGGKSGIRKVSRAKVKKWNGSTPPKYVWTHTIEEVKMLVPPHLRLHFMKQALEALK
jgi:hypothetical protein